MHSTRRNGLSRFSEDGVTHSDGEKLINTLSYREALEQIFQHQTSS
jgi:hypothetical protein